MKIKYLYLYLQYFGTVNTAPINMHYEKCQNNIHACINTCRKNRGFSPHVCERICEQTMFKTNSRLLFV